MKMVVFGHLKKSLNEKFKNYRLKNEVLIISETDAAFAELLSGCYAFIHPAKADDIGMDLLTAMKVGVPGLITKNESVAEWASDAFMTIDPKDIEGTADQMKLIFKDETFRSTLCKKALAIANELHFKKASDQLWNAIEQSISK